MKSDLTCPVEITKVTVNRETEDTKEREQVVCSIEFFNLSEKEIDSLQMNIICFDQEGTRLGGRLVRAGAAGEPREHFSGTFMPEHVDGAVRVTELNEASVAAGTAEKVAEVEAAIKAGTLKVFDVTTFTAPAVEGGSYVVDAEGHLTNAFATDTNGDWVADANEVVIDGAFSESSVQSAPYFAIIIDGITAVVE